MTLLREIGLKQPVDATEMNGSTTLGPAEVSLLWRLRYTFLMKGGWKAVKLILFIYFLYT